MNTIQLQSDTLRYMGVTLSNPHHISIHPGVTVVIGANGSGKSTFGRIIEKGWNIMTNAIKTDGAKPVVKFIEFSDIHSLSGCHVEYYQQRHEATMNDEVPTVAEIMATISPQTSGVNSAHGSIWRAWSRKRSITCRAESCANCL